MVYYIYNNNKNADTNQIIHNNIINRKKYK